MSFCVAVQSAIFYLASCTPCLQAKHHHMSKVQAKKERKEKERIQAEHPEMYQHPDPFNTNPYWSEEIMMGPHIEAKKYNSASKNTSQRGLSSAGNDQTSAAEGSAAGSSTAFGSPKSESSPTMVPEEGAPSLSTTFSDDWNRKRYQREDEELWGHQYSRAGHKLMDAIKHAGSSAHRRLEASLGMEHKEITEEDRSSFYFAPKNPPVNDYHPPIVRQKPLHKDAHKWMLQPPPAAKVMEGKVPVSRSGSMASHLSRRTTTSEGPLLGRLVHERAMEAKLRSGEFSGDAELRPTTSRTNSWRRATMSSHRQSLHSSQSLNLSLDSSDASEELTKIRKKSRARPPMTPEIDSSDEEDDEFYGPRAGDSYTYNVKAARRPKLQTIASSQASDKASKDVVPRTPASEKAAESKTVLGDVSNVQPKATSEPKGSRAGEELSPDSPTVTSETQPSGST